MKSNSKIRILSPTALLENIEYRLTRQNTEKKDLIHIIYSILISFSCLLVEVRKES